MPGTDQASGPRWDLYIDACRNRKVAERSIRWYVVRVERYISAHEGQSIRTHTPEQIRAYVEAAGRDHELPGWQFRQLVHALQILYCDVIRAEWSTAFDWQYWIDSARDLELQHPTIARHNHPIRSQTPVTADKDTGTQSESMIERELIAKIRV
jgi:Phage integrase, N-terminal SAM-like domain